MCVIRGRLMHPGFLSSTSTLCNTLRLQNKIPLITVMITEKELKCSADINGRLIGRPVTVRKSSSKFYVLLPQFEQGR